MRNRFKTIVVFLSLCSIFATCFAEEIIAQSTALTPQSHAVTLIEYYDDECPHCHKMGTVIEQLKAAYPKLKVIYRATPILSDESWVIASLVEAAGKQKTALHETLVSLPHVPTVDDVFYAASRLDINRQALLTNAKSAVTHKQLAHNIQLAKQASSLGVVALPLFVFSSSDKNAQHITLIGEQPYALLSAIIKQFKG